MGKSVIKRKVDETGKPITETVSVKFPITLKTRKEIDWLKSLHAVYVDNVNFILGQLKERFFEPFTVTAPDGKKIKLTLFDVFDRKFKMELPFTYRGSECNKSLRLYPCREIFNNKCPLAGISKDDIIARFKETLDGHTGKDTVVPSYFVNETVFTKVDGIITTYVMKKLGRISGCRDKTWFECCRETAGNNTDNDIDKAVLSAQLSRTGININGYINRKVETTYKWSSKDTCKVAGESFPVPAPDYGSKKFCKCYFDAVKLFIEKFNERFPVMKKMTVLPLPSSVIDVKHRNMHNYYDTPGTITNIPSVKGEKSKIEFFMHTVSGHSFDYYPEDIEAALKKEPKLQISFTGDIRNCQASEPVNTGMFATMPVIRPVTETALSETPKENDGIGIDLNVSTYLMNTTLPFEETTGAVDWTEAIHAFREEHPDDFVFTAAPSRVITKMTELADKGKSDMLNIGLLVGLRDYKPISEKYGWEPSRDPLDHLFRWMLDRKSGEKYFYGENQRIIIGYTKLFRKYVRKETANRYRYFAEQSKWDKAHSNGEVFADAAVAKELMEERAVISRNIDTTLSHLLVNGLFNVCKNQERLSYISMEDINLNEIRITRRVVPAYVMAKRNWGMTGGKLAVNGGTVSFDYSGTYDSSCISGNEYWGVRAVKHGPEHGHIEVTVVPTEKNIERSFQDWADHYTNKALHLSSIKHTVETLCRKRAIHFTTVKPEYTSSVCSACRVKKFKAEKSNKLSLEKTLAKPMNYRQDRIFVCGNPGCTMHGKVQDADGNAAKNILLKTVLGKNYYVKV